jgi:hypothetical protein
VVADERSGPFSGLSSAAPSAARPDTDTQSATFQVGGLVLELIAAPGAARLVVSGNGVRDTYAVDPAVLGAWATATATLLSLTPAAGPEERIEFRTPFLIDREGRPSIAFEGLVAEAGVGYRLIVSGASERVAGIMTTAEVVRGVAEAAAGAGNVARPAG